MILVFWCCIMVSTMVWWAANLLIQNLKSIRSLYPVFKGAKWQVAGTGLMTTPTEPPGRVRLLNIKIQLTYITQTRMHFSQAPHDIMYSVLGYCNILFSLINLASVDALRIYTFPYLISSVALNFCFVEMQGHHQSIYIQIASGGTKWIMTLRVEVINTD